MINTISTRQARFVGHIVRKKS